MTYSGNIVDNDFFLISNGTVNLKVSATILAQYINGKEPAPSGVTTNILDTDFFLIADGTVNYKISANDLANYVNTHSSQPSQPSPPTSSSGGAQRINAGASWGGFEDTAGGPCNPMSWDGSSDFYVAIGAFSIRDPVGDNVVNTGGIFLTSDSFNFSKVSSSNPSLNRVAISPDGTPGVMVGLDITAGSKNGVSQPSSLERSTDFGSNWTTVYSSSSSVYINTRGKGSEMMAIEHTSGSSVFSSDEGATWAGAGSVGSAGTIIKSLVPSRDPASSTWFATTYDKIFRTTDNGATWSNATTRTGTGPGLNNADVSTEVDSGAPGSGTWIAVVYRAGIKRTTNDGATWTTIPSPSGGIVWAVSYNETTSTWAMVDHKGLIHISKDDGVTWTQWVGVDYVESGAELTWLEDTNELHLRTYTPTSSGRTGNVSFIISGP